MRAHRARRARCRRPRRDGPNVIGVLEGRGTGRVADVLRAHRHRRRRRAWTRRSIPSSATAGSYGRGSQDMKGGVAAMIDAARLARDRGFRGPPDRRRRRRRGVRQPRRRRARHAVERRRGGRDRADRSADRRSATRASRGSRWRRAGAPRTAAVRATGATRSCAWAACCTRSSALDRELQSRPPHPLMGTASLHASIIEGGRELSSYPDRCRCSWSAARSPERPHDSVRARARGDPRRAAAGGSRVRRVGAI